MRAYFFFLDGRCVSADAAADFSAFEDDGSRSTFDAAFPAFDPVTSLRFAMSNLQSPPLGGRGGY